VLKKGEKLFLDQRVNPALIGGFVIDIGACCRCAGFRCNVAPTCILCCTPCSPFAIAAETDAA